MATWEIRLSVDGQIRLGPFGSIDAAIDAAEEYRGKPMLLEEHPIQRGNWWVCEEHPKKGIRYLWEVGCIEKESAHACAEGIKEARNNTVNGCGNWDPIRSEAHYHKWESGNVCY